DLARRFAKEGFVVLLPDLLSRAGGLGSISDAAQVPALVSASPERDVGDLRASVASLMARDEVRPGGVGARGHCFGGGVCRGGVGGGARGWGGGWSGGGGWRSRAWSPGCRPTARSRPWTACRTSRRRCWRSTPLTTTT